MLSLHTRTQLLLRLAICIVVFVAVSTIYFYVRQVYAAEPSSIRVLVTDEDPDVIRTVDYQEYLQDVLPNEWYPSWDTNSLRAGAVAVRTFGWYHTQHPLNPNYDLSDYTQRYIHDSDEPETGQAIDDTSGVHATYDGQVVWARYSREQSDPTSSSPGHSPPLTGVRDPVCVGADGQPLPRGDSHGEGVCQWGSQRWASGEDSSPNDSFHPRWLTYQHILVHYYTGIHLKDGNDQTLTPSLRWNPLSLDFHNPSHNTPPVMHQGQSYQITAFIQNTGFGNWSRDKPTQYYAFSYRWYDPRTDQTIDGNKAEIPLTVNKGMATTVTLTLNDVPDWEQGAYRLQLDMIWLSNITKQQYSEFWFGDMGWPSYDLSVCLNGPCRSFLPLVMKNWVAGCEPYTGYWYPVGTNTCDPAVSNCAQGDGQPDGVWAGSWKTGSHQVEFSPQLVQSNTEVGTYWRTKPDTDGYGHLEMYVQVDGVWQWVYGSQSQNTSGRWESVGIGSYAGEYITGLRFGFYWGSTWETDHEFEVDGYRMGSFMYCGE